MDRQSTSRRVNVGSTDFTTSINRMLQDEDPEDSSGVNVDDSDADPDIEPPEEARPTRYIDSESESEVVEDSDLLAEGESEEPVLIDRNLLEFVFGRLRKNECGPAYPWCTSSPTNECVRTPSHNIVRSGLPGLTTHSRQLGNKPQKQEVWYLLFEQKIIDAVVANTNVKLETIRNGLSENTNKSTYRSTDVLEVNALIGLFLLSSIFKSNHETMTSLFCKDATGRPYFTATMT